MFDNLSTKAKKFFDKKNKNPVAQYFQDSGYTQDEEGRSAQVLFLKLLMIVAYADDEIDDAELDLIRDYAFENSLNEQEWHEIDYFRRAKPSHEEIQGIIQELTKEIQSKEDKKKFLNAVKEIIESDSVIKKEEKLILDILEKELKEHSFSLMTKLVRGMKNSLGTKISDIQSERDSKKYVMNPVAPLLLEKLPGKDTAEIELISAVLGLAVVLIHADMEFHEKERTAFEELIKARCGVSGDAASEIAGTILDIPDTRFEVAYLGRIISEMTDEDERNDILLSLFNIAWADKVYDPQEDQYLRIISKYLFINHKTFIGLKLESRGE